MLKTGQVNNDPSENIFSLLLVSGLEQPPDVEIAVFDSCH